MSNIDDNSRSSPKDKHASRHHDGSAQESKDKVQKVDTALQLLDCGDLWLGSQTTVDKPELSFIPSILCILRSGRQSLVHHLQERYGGAGGNDFEYLLAAMKPSLQVKANTTGLRYAIVAAHPLLHRMSKSVLSIAVAALVIAAAPQASAQRLGVVQQAKIAVRVVGTLGVRMPAAPTDRADHRIEVPLCSDWNLAPGSALAVTFLAKVTDNNGISGSPWRIHQAVAKGAGSASVLVQVRRNGDAEQVMLTLELQDY